MILRDLWKQIDKKVYLGLAALIIVALFCTAPARAEVEISAQPYPVDNLRIFREDVTSSTFKLRLQNLDLLGESRNRSRAQTWMVAGLRGRTPLFEIESASFIQVKNGQVTSTTAEMPDVMRQSLVRIADLGLFRHWWVYGLTLTIVSPSDTSTYWVLQDAVIKMDIGLADENRSKKEKLVTTAGEDRLAGAMLINPDVSPAYYAVDYPDPVEAWSQWNTRIRRSAESNGLFRFSVYSGGIYQLSASTLNALTSKSITTPAARWRLFKDGQEVPLLAWPGRKDALILAVPPRPDNGLFEDVYWLDTTGKGDSEIPPARIVKASPVSPDADVSVTTTSLYTLLHRELKDYNPRLKAGKGADRWVWLDVEASRSTPFNLTMPQEFAPTSSTLMDVEIQYGFTNFPSVNPNLHLYVNGRDSGQTTLTAQQGNSTIQIDPSVLKPGTNSLGVALSYPSGTDVERPAVVQTIRTSWHQEPAIFSEAAVPFRFSERGPTTGSVAIAYPEGLPESTVVLGIRENLLTQLPKAKDHFTAQESHFQEYLAFDAGQSTIPKNLQKVNRIASLASLKSARSVIITHESLLEPANELAEVHKQRGLDVSILPTGMAYDLFSYGRPDPAAIRNALRYLYNKAPGNRPEYITVAGESSDFQGDLAIAPPGTQKNLVPASSSAAPESPQGDQLYAAAIGSDFICDFMVGRIPAADPAQFEGYIRKMKNYAAQEPGQWSRQAEFVMDDNDEFPEVVQQIVENTQTPGMNYSLLRQWDFQYEPNLRVPGKKRSWAATADLISKFNSGLGLLNFFGHGGPNLWSHERMLHLSDLPQIHNSRQLPLVTCASCDSAWITYPMAPVRQSMGEQLVLKPDGGAIGLFGPVSGASPYEHLTLVENLMDGMARVQLRHTGDLILYAKNQYYAISRSASIPDQYLLLGDPTVELSAPRTIPGLRLSEGQRIPAGGTITLKLDDAPALDAEGVLTLASGKTHENILTSVTVPAGQSEFTLPVPPEIQGGPLNALLEWHSDGTLHSVGGAVSVLPPTAQSLPQVTILAQEGEPYSLTPSEITAPPMTSGNNVMRFRIKGTDELSSSIRALAYVDGRQVAEAPRIDLAEPGYEATFELNGMFGLQPPLTTVTLALTSLTSAEQDAITTYTVLYPSDDLPDVAFVPGSARVYSKGSALVANNTVMLEAELQNLGKFPARNIVMQALRDNPSTGTELVTINEGNTQRLDDLAPGESRRVIFRWENPDAGKQDNLYLSVNRTKMTRELSYDNNVIEMPEFEVQRRGNFRVESVNVTPRYLVEGELTTITAVLAYDDASSSHTVNVEIGFEHSLDGKTTSTKFPVNFEDKFLTVSRELIVPPGYNQVYVKVNSDLEVEEANAGDNKWGSSNTILTAVTAPAAGQRSLDLTPTMDLGTLFNALYPRPGTIRVSPEFTSHSDYLLIDESTITSGAITTANAPDDNKWAVQSWKLAVAPGESAGPLSLKLPLPALTHDLPGRLLGFGPDSVPQETVDFRTTESSPWRNITSSRKVGNAYVYDFGRVNMESGSIEWQLSPTASSYSISYLNFLPFATEWISPLYRLPAELQNTPMQFSVSTDDPALWENIILDYRSGSDAAGGEINWTPWQTQSGKWSLQIPGAFYLQLRVIGVPQTGSQPYLENFKLSLP